MVVVMMLCSTRTRAGTWIYVAVFGDGGRGVTPGWGTGSACMTWDDTAWTFLQDDLMHGHGHGPLFKATISCIRVCAPLIATASTAVCERYCSYKNMTDQANATLPFANDGSFMEKFLKMQAEQKAAQAIQDAQPTPEADGAVATSTASGQQEPERGASSSVVLPVDSPDTAGTSGQEDGDDFIASASFRGARQGYVFKRDTLGVGYYRDASLADRIAAAKQAAKSKPVVLKANNPLLKSLGKRGVDLPAVVPGGKKSKQGESSTTASEQQRCMACLEKLPCWMCGSHPVCSMAVCVWHPCTARWYG